MSKAVDLPSFESPNKYVDGGFMTRFELATSDYR
jgi:hypothetical protein